MRAVSHAKQRVNEAEKLGFHTCIMPAVSMEGLELPKGMKCIGVKNVFEAIQVLRR